MSHQQPTFFLLFFSGVGCHGTYAQALHSQKKLSSFLQFTHYFFGAVTSVFWHYSASSIEPKASHSTFWLCGPCEGCQAFCSLSFFLFLIDLMVKNKSLQSLQRLSVRPALRSSGTVQPLNPSTCKSSSYLTALFCMAGNPTRRWARSLD